MADERGGDPQERVDLTTRISEVNLDQNDLTVAEDAEEGEVWEEAVDVAILTEEANECTKDTAAVTGPVV